MANYDVLRRAVRYALFANAAAAVAIPVAHAADAAPAPAPDETPSLTEVIVTGTRLVEPGLTSVSPVTSISAEEIKQQGAVRIEDLLNTLPQVFADQGSTVSNGATGEATVNLRNLGVQRTLVLVNGRRLMPGDPAPPQFNGFSAPDLNNIPAALVERVDVLTGGASSVYGADAVAGVVNFVMNDHFEGLKIDVNAAGYEHSQHSPIASTVSQTGDALPAGTVLDGASKDVNLIFGKNLADGSGNFTAYVGYRKFNALLESARDFSACEPGLSAGTATGWTCLGSSTAATGRIIPLNYSGGPLSPTLNPAGYTVGPGGALVPWGNQYLYNFAPTNYFQRPDERWTAGEFLHLDVAEKMQVYNEFMFMHDTSIAQIAPGGAFLGAGTSIDPNTGIGNGGVNVNCNNPYLSASELQVFCNGSTAGTSQIQLGRRNVEGGNRINDLEHTSFRAVVGLRGEVADGWKYDTYIQEGRTEYSNFGSGNFSKTALSNALDAVTDPTTGQVVCANSQAAGCVPYNPWGTGAGITPAALNYVTIPTVLTGNTEERIWDGNLTGDLGKYGLKVPGNDSGLIVNVGSQWRSEAATLHSDQPDINFDVAGNGSPILPLAASFHVWEGYVEGGLPILADQPFAKELSVETGYRYSSYNIGFNTNTYKFGINWAPDSDVRFRASYNRAVRAPNLQELFTQKLISLEGSYDPCTGSTTGVPTATLAQCVRTGLSPAQYGKLIPNSAGQYQGLVGGNPQLKPEQSDTTSFGVVLTPSFVPGLTMELDYYKIRIKNVISSYTFPLELTQCLNTGNSYFCGNVHRDANGTLWASPDGYINDPTLNLGALQNEGVDVTATYKLDLNQWGKVNFGLYGTYTEQLITQPGGQLGVLAYNCAGYFGSTCGVPTPKWKHKLRADYTTPIEGLGVGLQWRYLSAVSQDVNSPNLLLAGTNGPPATIPNYMYFDMTASYTVNKNVSVRLGVNNVLDKDPPLVSVRYFSSAFVNGNTYPGVYDALGRYLFANITMQF
jgi:iron complex outermembrane receptor protein